MIKGKLPYDKAVAESDAVIIETLGKLPWHAFVPNSITAKSRAKEEIWQQQDKFKAAADKMQAETTKLTAATKTGDLATIKTAFAATAQSCKACHDNYRKKTK
jgi:cytochrome c556